MFIEDLNEWKVIDEHHQIMLMLSFVFNKNVFALRSVQKKTKLKQPQFFF